MTEPATLACPMCNVWGQTATGTCDLCGGRGELPPTSPYGYDPTLLDGTAETWEAVVLPLRAKALADRAEALRELRRSKVDPETADAFDRRASFDEVVAAKVAELHAATPPQPLVDAPDLPSWPTHVLPGWMADHVHDTAERLQVPVDLCAQLAVGALAAACTGHATVSAGSWTETVNLFLWVAMHSGAGKSPAEKAMVGPLREWERQRRTATAEDHALDLSIWKIAQKRRADDEKGFAIGSIGIEALRESVAAAEKPKPVPFRLIVDDTTPERLVQLLGSHKRLALISTEAGLLDAVAGTFAAGRTPNIDVYLKAWAGETIIRDRKGGDEGPEFTVVEDALLSVVLTIQPSVVEKYRSTAPELRGRGFFARFMPSIPASLVGARTYGDMRPPGPSAAVYADELSALASRMVTTDAPIPLRLDDEASAVFFAWCDAMEAELVPGGRLDVLHDAASKIRSSTLRLAGLLELADGRHGPHLGVEVMRRALEVGDYWTAHAMAMERAGGVTEDDQAFAVRAATDIVRWAIRRNERFDFTPRQVWLSLRRSYRAMEMLVPGFELLADRGWLWFTSGDLLEIGTRGARVHARLHPDAFTLSEQDLTLGRRTRARTRTPISREFSSSSSLYTHVREGEAGCARSSARSPLNGHPGPSVDEAPPAPPEEPDDADPFAPLDVEHP